MVGALQSKPIFPSPSCFSCFFKLVEWLCAFNGVARDKGHPFFSMSFAGYGSLPWSEVSPQFPPSWDYGNIWRG